MMEASDTNQEIALTNDGNLQRAGESLGRAAGTAVAKAREFLTLARERADRVRERTVQVKEQKPLQILAVLVGLSAAAGFAMRFWRISRNA